MGELVTLYHPQRCVAEFAGMGAALALERAPRTPKSEGSADWVFHELNLISVSLER